eukprot:s6688_g5.t1
MGKWRNPHMQHDVAEFLNHVLSRLSFTKNRLATSWQARSQGQEWRVQDLGYSTSVVLPTGVEEDASSSRKQTVQDMIQAWHRQEDVHALVCWPSAIILQAGRFDFDAAQNHAIKRRYELWPSAQISVPRFEHDQRVHWKQYQLCSVIIHEGDSPDSGHYFNLVYDLRNSSYCVADDGECYRVCSDSEDFMGKAMKDCFDGTEEEKACEVVPARMESLEKTIQRLQSRKEAESPESPWLPLLFGEDSEAKPFPSLSAPDSGSKDEAEPKAKAKQKDGKKGSKESTPSAAKGGYQYPQGYYGFPGGFPPYPGYNPAVYAYAQIAAAQNAQAIQVAQLQAQASARKHAGKGGAKSGLFPSILDPLAAAVNHKELPSGFLHTACSCVCQENEELSEDQKAQLRHQVEYYFSTDNLCKDLFLREHMERDGWVALDLIRTFPRVSKFSVSSKKLMEACAKSEKLEIDDNQEKIRLANADERSKWANTPVPPDYKKRSA